MAYTKRDEVRTSIQRNAEEAILLHTTKMGDRVLAETIRQNAHYLANSVCWHLCEEYRFLELSDIFEWKRQKVRR
jgi:hypothetical protein